MRYYTIQNNGLLIAENRYALERFYDNVSTLPQDYEQGKYIVEDGELVLNPNWEQEQAEKERERINNLTCTKRVFALGLQQLGISYSQLKEIISSDEQAQLEWDLCERLERKNPLLNALAEKFRFESAKIDEIFIKANM